MPDYVDLTIRIRPLDAAGFYPVEVESDDGTKVEDGQLRLDAGRLRAAQTNADAYGRLLHEALFAGSIRDAYLAISERAASQTEGRLRVRLRLDARAAELHALPWERLYHLRRGDLGPLATSVDTPFSRYTSQKTADYKPVGERPLRLLVAVANPANLAALGLTPVDLAAELETVRLALAGLAGQWMVTLLPGQAGLPPELAERLTAAGWKLAAGPTSLEAIKRQLPGQHVFHFIGHGALARQAELGEGTAALYLENDLGQAERVLDGEIVPTLKALGNDLPHLVFLVACESAKRQLEALAAAEHPFIGLGPKLVQAGVPAVVAMQAKMPIDTARDLTQEFYRRLAEHGEVDRAMSQARYVVYRPNREDWAIPVLFSRLADGVLFEETKMPEEQTERGGGVNIKAGGKVKVKGRIAEGDLTETTTQSGTGNVNTGGGNVGQAVNVTLQQGATITGDIVGRDKITTTINNAASGLEAGQLVELLRQFAAIKRQVDGLPEVAEEDKQDLKTNVGRIEEEVKKGETADATKVDKALKKIAGMSDDILKVVVATLSNPAAGIATAVQLIARKAKAP